MKEQQINVLDQLTLINLDIDQWSGQSKLDESEIDLGEGGSLPPKEFATLGSKFLVDKTHFRVFTRLRNQAKKLCLSIGHRFSGGYAISNGDVEYILDELDKIEDEYNQEIDKFVINYQSALADWCEKNPGWAKNVYASAPKQEQIRERFKCEFTAFKIGGATQRIQEELENRAKGLGGEIFNEITEQAREFYTERLLSQESVNKRSLDILLGWHKKLSSLAFLNHRFHPMIALLDEAIFAYNNCKGPLKGRSLHVVMAAILTFSDSKTIDQYLNGQLRVADVADQTYSMAIGQKPLVVPQTEPAPQPSVTPGIPVAVSATPFPLPKVTVHQQPRHVSRNLAMF